MTIPTLMSLHGFIATGPELNFTGKGHARFYALNPPGESGHSGHAGGFTRIGVEQFRKEVDGSFTKLDPTFHNLVMFDRSAEPLCVRLLGSVFHGFATIELAGDFARSEPRRRRPGSAPWTCSTPSCAPDLHPPQSLGRPPEPQPDHHIDHSRLWCAAVRSSSGPRPACCRTGRQSGHARRAPILSW